MAGNLAKIRWINKGAQHTVIDITKAEEHYGAIYIADLCIKNKNGDYAEEPLSVFYQPNPRLDLKHTHYFGLFYSPRSGLPMITNAIDVSEGIWNGAVADSGEIVFSRWRHDYRTSVDGSVMVDGGRDYFKYSARPDQHVKLKIVACDFVICDQDG